MMVNKWSVKIQHQGRRRTFSLQATSRSVAAREAQTLYETLRTAGWDAAVRVAERRLRAGSDRPLDEPLKAGTVYWRERLVQRKYAEARLDQTKEFSVRIEHSGRYCYFPVGTADENLAATRAAEIYQVVAGRGWDAAFHQFCREITVALFWTSIPAACTYTTLFTFVDDPPETAIPVRERVRPPRKVALVEVDPEVRRTLAFWLDRQPGFRCSAVFKSAADALASIDREPPDVLLVNRAQSEMPAGTFLQRLSTQRPALPAFLFGVYEDSDQIFVNLSGVTAGYIFRRRLPTDLFEPIQPALRQRVFSAKEAFAQVRNYFQSFFGVSNLAEENPAIAHLTAREQDILSHVSKGYLDKEIADALQISIWTVHNHLKHIYEKLNVHTRTEAVLKYLQK